MFSSLISFLEFQLLGDRLGKGAFGQVFHALNAANGEFVAVKKLPTKYADAGAILDIEVNANKD